MLVASLTYAAIVLALAFLFASDPFCSSISIETSRKETTTGNGQWNSGDDHFLWLRDVLSTEGIVSKGAVSIETKVDVCSSGSTYHITAPWSRRAAAGRAQLRALALGGAVWDAFCENANCGDPVG